VGTGQAVAGGTQSMFQTPVCHEDTRISGLHEAAGAVGTEGDAAVARLGAPESNSGTLF